MPEVSASVLIVGHPEPETVKFGADFLPHLNDVDPSALAKKYAVVVLSIPPSEFSEAKKLLRAIGENQPLGQRIVIHHGSSGEILKNYIDQATIFQFLPSFKDVRFERSVQEALEEFDLLKQNEELMNLVREQNDRLRRLGQDLEERVKKRQKSLLEAERRLKTNQQRTLLLQRALVAIHSSPSLTVMEHQITEALAPQLDLLWTRILFPTLPTPSFIDEDKSIHTLQLPLFEGSRLAGQVAYARAWDKPFSKEETSLLTSITEAVSLATRRLHQLAQSENLKSQWEATFDAISAPLSVVDAGYNIRRANKAYAERCGKNYDQVIGRQCYQMLFQRTSPCPGCTLGTPFRWTDAEGKSPQVLDVHSQKLALDPEDPTYLQIYTDVSEKLRLERQILESSKMAELGTIGSSIAHELNNPLGGILNFLQLIKMDLPADSHHLEDIQEMEAAGQRCKAIIENLLGFSRKSDLHELRPLAMREVVQQAIQIVELKSRSLGVDITLLAPEREFLVLGRFNLLSQAVHNLLQNAFEAVAERMKKERGFKGQIQVTLQAKDGQAAVSIRDNGSGFEGSEELIFAPLFSTKDPEKHSGLGLSVARQIVQEHGGHLVINRRGRTTEALLTVPLSKKSLEVVNK